MPIDDDFLYALEGLRPRQLARIEALARALAEGTTFDLNAESDFADESFAHEFGDQLRLHHNGSAQPLSKDRFEYAMVSSLNDSGHAALKLPNGNPGEDIVNDGEPWSLKTQADRGIKSGYIHISKFMELGRGAWETVEDIEALRERMFRHMQSYERIFTLRNLSRTPVAEGSVLYQYELVEIPKGLLLRSAHFPIEIKLLSRQNPKPASCYVRDGRRIQFELYFDGGTERKLQIKSLDKADCVVHVTWNFTAES